MNNEHTVAPKTTLQSLKEEVHLKLMMWNKPEHVLSDTESKKHTGFDCSVWIFKGDVDSMVDSLIEKAFTAGKEEELTRVERASQELENALVDTETNFGMNESYRLALSELSHKLVALKPIKRLERECSCKNVSGDSNECQIHKARTNNSLD